MSDKLCIDLEKCFDKMGQPYYIGKLKGPVLLDCSAGIAFLVFTSIDGQEELQIAHLTKRDKPNDNR